MSDFEKINKLANEHYQKEEYEKAFPLYQQAAEAGDSIAQFNLALMYENGMGTPQNFKKAIEWYSIAAEAGDSTAKRDLTLMYIKGECAGEDINTGMEWMKKATVQSNEANPITRSYNYNLETGTVGTDDENIANILYNINRMEMNKSFTSSNLDESKEALGNLYFIATDAMVHLNRFLDIYEKKVKLETSDTVVIALDDAFCIIDAVAEETDTAKISVVFPAVYKILLDIVPSVLELDAQAVGRV